MKKEQTIGAKICLIIILLFFLTIVVRTFTLHVLVLRMGMNNKAISMIMYGFDYMNYQPSTVTDTPATPVPSYWAVLYPFEEPDPEPEVVEESWIKTHYVNRVLEIENTLNLCSSEQLPGYNNMVVKYDQYQELINWDAKYLVDTDIVIMNMDNGYLTFLEKKMSEEVINENADSVAKFSAFVEDQGIDFYYINAGSKVDPDDKQLSDIARLNEFTNENGDELLAALKKRGVTTYDFRDMMKEDGLDWYDCYYRTDHHWNTRMGLWSAKKIAEILNKNSGFEYDLELFSEKNYNFETYKDFWYGGQAVSKQLEDCEKEDFELITPKFDTYFYLSIPSISYEQYGKYDETLLNMDLLEAVKGYSDEDFLSRPGPYYIARTGNYALSTIKNGLVTTNQDKKVLIIGDSFGWFTNTYLACGTASIDIIYAAGFTGSIREYVRQTQPDVVIMMYCEKNIYPIEWNNHETSFDLR